jgi:hypothetical protein
VQASGWMSTATLLAALIISPPLVVALNKNAIERLAKKLEIPKEATAQVSPPAQP